VIAPGAWRRGAFALCAALLAACSAPRPSAQPSPVRAAQYDPNYGGAGADGLGPLQLGLEVQAYPAGVIPGVHARWALDRSSALTARVAANITDRGDFGEFEDESGEGFGAGVGYRRALEGSLASDGWLWGARVDLWSLEIDWEDPGRSGTTDILVLQPTVEFGYGWALGSGGRLELVAGAGAEINVDTDGEDVGEGAIGLLGLTWIP